MKKILLAIILVLSIVGLSISAYKFSNYSYALTNYMGTEEWYKDYTYNQNDTELTITLTKYNGESAEVVVPSSATINGNNYQTIIAAEVYRNNKTVSSITFENGVKAAANISRLFQDASNLTNITLNNFDTSGTTNMSFLFSGTKIESIDLSNLNTSNVIYMNSMFKRCSSLKNLDLSNFNTSNVTNMSNMFASCSALKKLDLSMFDTYKVVDMSSMFFSTGITELDISNFDTTNLTSMKSGSSWASPITKIKIGPKTDFKTGLPDTGGSFGRGMWLREEDGKQYAAIDIALNSSTKDMSGTYTKVSNSIPEMNVNFVATYKINKFNSYEMNSTNNNIKLKDNHLLIYNLNYTNTDDYQIPGNVTFMFSDSVIDAQGNNYDMKLTVDNIHLYDLNEDQGYTNFVHHILDINNASISLQSFNYPDDNFGTTMYHDSPSSYDLTLEILDKSGNAVNGSYVFSAYDIDIPSTRDNGYGLYSEGVNLLEGYDINTLKMANHTYLQILNNNRITGTHYDESSELSQFLVEANARKFKFSWTGQICGTTFFSNSQPSIVEIEKQDDNGNILSGANLELYYGEYGQPGATLVDSAWTSTSSSKKLFLMPGYYSLREVSAPNGYKVSNIITFSVDSAIMQNGEIVPKVIVKNTPNVYEYKIYHVVKSDTCNATISEENQNCSTILETVQNRANFNSIVNITDKNLVGYSYDSKSKDKINILADESKNIAYVYYVKNKYNYAINYYDKETCDDEMKNCEYLDKFQSQAEEGTILKANDENIYKDFSGYTYELAEPETITITSDLSKNVLNLYYVRKTGKVITKYVDIDTGKEIDEDEIIDGKEGDKYITSKKDISGYEYVKVEGKTEGTIKDIIEVTFYYKKKVLSPQTSDNRNIIGWIVLGLISITGAAITSIYLFKKRK